MHAEDADAEKARDAQHEALAKMATGAVPNFGMPAVSAAAPPAAAVPAMQTAPVAPQHFFPGVLGMMKPPRPPLPAAPSFGGSGARDVLKLAKGLPRR